MEIIILIVFLGASILVAFDAKKHQITTSDKPYSINNGALAWFFLCILPCGVPFSLIYYLIRKKKTLRIQDDEQLLQTNLPSKRATTIIIAIIIALVIFIGTMAYLFL